MFFYAAIAAIPLAVIGSSAGKHGVAARVFLLAALGPTLGGSLLGVGVGVIQGAHGAAMLTPALLIVVVWFCVVGGLAWLSGVRRLRRAYTGSCLKCRYDLRGLPEPRCPECGWFHEEAPSPVEP